MLSTFRATGRRGPVLLVLLMVVAFVAACSGSAGTPQGVGAPPAIGASGGGDASGSETGGQGAPAAGPGSNDDGSSRGIAYLADTPNLLIIKTGEMVLQVTGIDAALATATDQIKALGGYASGSDRSGDGESDQASITFRVPAAAWDQAVAGLRALATKVLAERSGTEDVTTQVVDLAARIKNLQVTETALQGVMTQAVEIKDILAVQSELTNVRGQIEQAVAEKTHLENQAAYSTLTVTFSLKPDPVLTSTTAFDPKTQVDEAAASLVGILQGVASAGIWFAIVWLPILIALGILALIVIWVMRRLNRATAGSGPAAPTAPAAPSAESGA
ncbi:MAG TPA: DUF4349 domain-containing protein [Candidatus Limnocylindrales bacterium]|nr:DUF4349 domain-containing protein [Candidatus Limnocylindrales bacterium]